MPSSSLARWSADRSVGTKVLAAVVLAAVVALAVGAVSVLGMRGLAAGAAAVYEEGAVPLQVLGELNLAQDDTRRELLNVLVSQSPADIEDNRGDVGTADARFRELGATYREHAVQQGGGREAVLDDLMTAWESYSAVRDQTLMPLAVDSLVREYDAAAKAQAAPITEVIEEKVAALIAIEDASAKALRADADERASSATRLTVLGAAGRARPRHGAGGAGGPTDHPAAGAGERGAGRGRRR